LTGKNLPALLAAANGELFQFSALPYTDEEMEVAPYSVDLPAGSATVLNIAAKTLGVGTASCGPRPIARSLIHTEPTEFSYTLRLVSANDNVPVTARVLPPANNAKPLLVKRDAKGDLALTVPDGNVAAVSTDGAEWTPYTKPLVMTQPTKLWFRNTAANGETFIGVVSFQKFVNRSKWKVTASSHQRGEGEVRNAIDGDAGTFWHSQYSSTMASAPHWIVIDLGEEVKAKTFVFTPRQDGVNGRMKDYEVYVSANGENWGAAVLKGEGKNSGSPLHLSLKEPLTTRYVKLVINTSYPEGAGNKFATLAEFDVILAE
jgi:beta-galactosidase